MIDEDPSFLVEKLSVTTEIELMQINTILD